jgi:hypothetical protein
MRKKQLLSHHTACSAIKSCLSASKNAGATYQRMMQNCLGSQIGCNIQVYIDDVVITTRKEE